MNKLKIMVGTCSVLAILLIAKLSNADSYTRSMEIQPLNHGQVVVRPYPEHNGSRVVRPVIFRKSINH